ncbi:MAG: DUF6285 domain-containing protein [Acidimicrobiia bacterium]|nr:DUF6285 domain-containing protein [Acidimicrobiia bacterium]
MIDRPDATTLLSAMADALIADVASALGRDPSEAPDPTAHYTTRVVANLCRILARETELGPAASRATIRDLECLLGRPGSLPELVARLDDRLTVDGKRPVADRLDRVEVFNVLKADVARRLAIARPDYAVPGQ